MRCLFYFSPIFCYIFLESTKFKFQKQVKKAELKSFFDITYLYVFLMNFNSIIVIRTPAQAHKLWKNLHSSFYYEHNLIRSPILRSKFKKNPWSMTLLVQMKKNWIIKPKPNESKTAKKLKFDGTNLIGWIELGSKLKCYFIGISSPFM